MIGRDQLFRIHYTAQLWGGYGEPGQKLWSFLQKRLSEVSCAGDVAS